MARLIINTKNKKSKINKELYGHFSEHLGRGIYEGIYVGKESQVPNTNGIRNDVITALREIKVPVLRWPGGCFADEYHWKDGIGPKEDRKKTINTHWGGLVEDNSFGTHEFMELCRQLECKTYINGNLGSGTVQEMSEWVEYMTFDGLSPMSELRKKNGREEPWQVDYFGVGNENWGCGGNFRPEYYADEYRRYQTYVRSYHKDKKIMKIACGANADDFEWTKRVLETCSNYGKFDAARFMDGLSLHYYTIPTGEWGDKGSATEFSEKLYYETLEKTLYMEQLIKGHGAVMDSYDPEKKIGMIIDEWGTWYNAEPGTVPGFLYQQNTMRDAMVAAINLNLFNKHSDRVKMANIAQMVNVLQAVILTEGEKLVLTPTYYVFQLFRDHQESTLLESIIETEEVGCETVMIPQVSESVSEDAEGNIHITLANVSACENCSMDITLLGKEIRAVTGEVLSQEIHAKNTFEDPFQVRPESAEGFTFQKDIISCTVPACGVLHLIVK